MPCSSSSAANLPLSSQPPASTSSAQTPNPGIKSVNNFSHHQQIFQHQQEQQQLQQDVLAEYYYGSQPSSFEPVHPSFAMTASMDQQQQYFVPSTTPPDSFPVPSLVYPEMSQHPQHQNQHQNYLQQQQQKLQPPIQHQVSVPTSPVSTKSFGGTLIVRSASVKRPHPADSNALNDQKPPDQRSPQHIRTPSRKRGDSNVSIKSRRKRGDSNASSISSQSPRYPASGVPITLNSNEVRSSSYTKKASELGIAKLNLVGNSVSAAGSGSVNSATQTHSILSPQRRKTNLINFSIANGRAVVSSTEDPHSVVNSREPSPVSSPKIDDDSDNDNVSGPTPSRNRADDAIIALKEVISRVKLPFGLDKKQFTRSRANSVPVPAAARFTAPSDAGSMSVVTVATTPVGPPRKKTVDPTPPPHKKRVCSSVVSSPQRPPASPSYMQSPHTSLNSPASISAPTSAMGASRSPFSEIDNSPRVLVDKASHSAVQNQSLPLPLQSSHPPYQLHQYQPIPQQQLHLLPRQHVSSQQPAPINEDIQYHYQQHQQPPEQHLQNNFQYDLRQQQYLHQQMLDQQLAFQQQQHVH